MAISVKPLGAGQEVGRSCVIVKIKDVKVMFDCGVHMVYNDSRKFPDFKKILDMNDNVSLEENSTTVGSVSTSIRKDMYANLEDKIDYNKHLDLVIITHFHLDHCGALPYFTELCGYSNPILTTQPTKAILPITLEDFRRIISDYRGENSPLAPEQIKNCMDKIQTIEIGETRIINNRIKVTTFYAGHVMGAGIYKVEVDGYSVVYTGDYNTLSDRHLAGAYVPKIYPNILITETTYGDTIRDTKKVREREFLKKIQSTIDKGGKVLIPIFALGRAQELCILLDTYWKRTKCEVPIYFAGPLAEKANFYYKIFTNWMNSKIKNSFLERNVFDFNFIKQGDKSVTKSNQPMVIFATPGMLHGGLSLSIFKEIAVDNKNCVIIPGYCTAGTVGNKILSGERLIEIDKQMVEVRCDVYYMSFSAHADAKGLMELIKNVSPKNLVLVHGDVEVMKNFQKSVETNLNISTKMPANFDEIFFNLYEFYYQISIDHSLFNLLNVLFVDILKEKFKFDNQIKFFPYLKLTNNEDKQTVLGIFNPINQGRNKIRIKNKVTLRLNESKTLNIQSMFEEFLQKFYPSIGKKFTSLTRTGYLVISYLNDCRIELKWENDNSNVHHLLLGKDALVIIKYIDTFIKILFN